MTGFQVICLSLGSSHPMQILLYLSSVMVSIIVLLLYVDDIILTGSDAVKVQNVIS